MFRDLVEGSGRDLADVQVLAVGLPGPIDRETGRTASPAILPGGPSSTCAPRSRRPWASAPSSTMTPTWAPSPRASGASAAASPISPTSRWPRASAPASCSTATSTGASRGPLVRSGIPPSRRTARSAGAATAAVSRCSPPDRHSLEPLLGSYSDDLTVEDLVRLSNEGDIGCRRVITDAGRHIGVALANLCNLLSPQMIIIGGELALAGDVLLTRDTRVDGAPRAFSGSGARRGSRQCLLRARRHPRRARPRAPGERGRRRRRRPPQTRTDQSVHQNGNTRWPYNAKEDAACEH